MKILIFSSFLQHPVKQAAWGWLITAVLCFSPSAIAAQCLYTIVDEWNAGFKVEMQIVNDGEPITDWQLSWPWQQDHVLNNSWNANIQCENGQCTATPPPWLTQIGTGQSHGFGFVASKNAGTAQHVTLAGDICTSGAGGANQTGWALRDDLSRLSYVSVKKAHTAELNHFAAGATPVALRGEVDAQGRAVLAINLNSVASGIEIRDSRLRDILFNTQLLPHAYFETQLDIAHLSAMAPGEVQLSNLGGEFSLHGSRQTVSAEVLIARVSQQALTVSSVKPVLIDSKAFDLDAGIEALRVIANLSDIGEAVPVYFHLVFEQQSVDLDGFVPSVPAAPANLSGEFNAGQGQASLTWQDNSDNETRFVVRRKAASGRWQTTAESLANVTQLSEALPDAGEFDYKVIALNQDMPSFASNIARVAVTQGNPLVRGQQIFAGNCAGCHGTKGEGTANGPAINTERSVPDMVSYITDFMPLGNPAGCDAQCAEDVSTFIQTLWVSEEVCDARQSSVSYGARQLKILTRFEYQNTVRDLLGVDYDASAGLSADNKVGFFLNNTHASVVPSSYSNFLLVAEEVADWSAQRDFAPALSCSRYDQDCADQFMATLVPKIFRRPLTESEHAAFLTLANGSHTQGDVKAGIAMALEALLSAPQFLYRHELGSANPDNPDLDSDGFELTSHEMATFLSYTFTGSTPDDELLAAAGRDELRDPQIIAAQASRLATGAKSVMSQFVGSWLGTEDLALAAKDPSVWPGFAELVPHMQNELNEGFAYVMLHTDESFASLYTANYSFLNETLAQHYGINGVTGNAMRQVPTAERGGILANGAFMARWGEAVETSPILRSVRVRRRMLCQDQPDPPAGTFAAREQKLAELSDLLQDPSTTNRLKYHRLTEDVPCTSCHLEYINPLGFGMEDFDSVGRVRGQDLNGNSIDASGALYAPLNYGDLDEVLPFNGTRDLGRTLATLSSAQACLPQQMFRFIMGVGHDVVDPDNPQEADLPEQERAGYACELDALNDALINDSPRAMLEAFGALDAVRYRKAWARE